MRINEFNESQQRCPKCGGPSFSDLVLAEKQDACYAKVKSRYKVWPSAYASGALVQCRKKGAANWGNKSKNEAANPAQQAAIAIAKKKKAQGVAEGDMYGDEEVSWEKGGRRAPTGAFRNPAAKKPYNDPDWTKNLPKEKLDALAGPRYKKDKKPGVAESLNELEVPVGQGTANQTYTPPSRSFGVMIKGKLPPAPGGATAEDVWETLERILPRDYPRVPFQQQSGNEPQRRVIVDLNDDGFSIVKQNISSEDIAATIASKFKKYRIPAEVIDSGIYEEEMARKVDAKGRTQQQWIQAVKQKFPDAKIMQSKMIDGPVQALLSDGRKLSWNKVEQPMAEARASSVAFRASNAKRAKLNAMTPEERKAYDKEQEEKQRKRDDARLEKERKKPAAKKGVAEGKEDKIAQLKKDYDTAVHWSKNDTNPHKREAARQKADKIKAHLEKQYKQGVAEEYNAEYDDEAGMADNNLSTLRRAVEGLDDLIDTGDNLPEWCQEKIAVAKSMLVSVWDYMESEDDAEEEFDLIESIIDRIAAQNGVDAEMIWEDLESLTEDELYAFAVTSQLNEDWSKVNKKDKTDGMSQKAVNAYRRENPGSKLKTAVTTKPSKLKKGSKASKRRKSYCSRSRGQMKMHNISCAKTPDKAICKARRRWNC